LKLDIFFVHF